jgi:hypothetical protein
LDHRQFEPLTGNHLSRLVAWHGRDFVANAAAGAGCQPLKYFQTSPVSVSIMSTVLLVSFGFVSGIA